MTNPQKIEGGTTTPIYTVEMLDACRKPLGIGKNKKKATTPIQETWQEELRKIVKMELEQNGDALVNWGKEDMVKPINFLEAKLRRLISSLLQRKERETIERVKKEVESKRDVSFYTAENRVNIYWHNVGINHALEAITKLK